jgi:hypothetical protein
MSALKIMLNYGSPREWRVNFRIGGLDGLEKELGGLG